jgi:hypothetical protein
MEEFTFEYSDSQSVMQDHIAEICFELNIIKSNYPEINIDKLTSKLESLINICDKVLADSRENESKLDTSLRETSILESKLCVEKEWREQEINHSLHMQELVEDDKLILKKEIKVLEEQLKKSNDKIISLMDENSDLVKRVTSLKKIGDTLEGKINNQNSTIAKLELKLQTAVKGMLNLQSKDNWGKDKWADDTVLNGYFSAMAETINNRDILFLGPSVTAVIRFGAPDVVTESLRVTSFTSCKYVFLCVSNSLDGSKEDAGSHWSLLFIDKSHNKAYHFDSLSSMNNFSAKIVAGKLGYGNDVIEMTCMQQKQSFECGLHVLANAKYIAYHYCVKNTAGISLIDWMAGAVINNHGKEVNPTSQLQTDVEQRSVNTAASEMPKSGQKKEKWQRVEGRRKSLKNKQKGENLHFVSRNRFEVLDKTSGDDVGEITTKEQNTNLSFPPEILKTNALTFKEKKCHLKTRSKTEAEITNKQPKIVISSDSHGKDLYSYLNQACNNVFNIFNHCQPGAPLETLMKTIENYEHLKVLNNRDFVVLFGGTNNITATAKANPKQFLSSLEVHLKDIISSLKHTNLIICTVPYRYDLHASSTENHLIKELNLAILRLTCDQTHTKIINVWNLERWFHTRHGLHINRKGKKFVCNEIMKIVESHTYSTSDNSLKSTPLKLTPVNEVTKINDQTQSTPPDSVDLSPQGILEPIRVVEADMLNVIDSSEGDTTVAFAHCISADFEDRRQMSRGVAVSFKKRIGKPARSDCINSYVSLQYSVKGAAVYGLITKEKFNNKPKLEDYDHAFSNFADDFKAKGFKKLFCSPLGCTRDKIPPKTFAKNIVKFYNSTKASIEIVVQNERSTRNLRGGLKHSEFVDLLRTSIAEELSLINPPTPPSSSSTLQSSSTHEISVSQDVILPPSLESQQPCLSITDGSSTRDVQNNSCLKISSMDIFPPLSCRRAPLDVFTPSSSSQCELSFLEDPRPPCTLPTLFLVVILFSIVTYRA